MPGAPRADLWRLHRHLLLFVLGFIAFLLLMHSAERNGLSRDWIGPIFLFLSIMLYACIGIYSRTTDPEDFYVAGRRIPAMYNGMATAADWMSAASFISLSGALYLQGFSGTAAQPGGLAYVLGWTGGFVLVALLVAPHLRAMRLYTLPDFFQQRFGGSWPRIIAALSAVLCSFTYVVAQIYGVGLIASRLTGVQFEIGIMLGLGGVLVCSFLGGMKAITWTQVSQYIVVLLAFLAPMSWLAYKQLGNPVAAVAYDSHLQAIADMETRLLTAPEELQVRQEFERRAPFLGIRVDQEFAPRSSLLANPARLAGLDILFVDDVPLNQEVVRDMLQDAGMTVRIASNGREALDEIARKRPDCVLMDCQMPGVDGLAATGMALSSAAGVQRTALPRDEVGPS